MRNLFEIILFTPRLIISIIWNFLWAILRMAVIIGIVCFGLLHYANNSSPQSTNMIPTITSNVTSYFSASSGDIANSLEDLSADDLAYYSGTRRSGNSANAYTEATSETLIGAYEEATNTRDATGAFTFSLVSNRLSANIVVTDYSGADSRAVGLAKIETDALTDRITRVNVKLNTYYLTENDYDYTHNHIVYTTEHELGHAIKLSHGGGEQSAMQSLGSYYSTQGVDI